MRKLKYIFIMLIIFIIPFCAVDTAPSSYLDNMITVHYIDVDQGDAILIMVNQKSLLIDSGPKISKNKLINYLKSLHLNYIDYVVATHPHEDHIGNMSTIINNFKIGAFYAPKISQTTKSFENMVQALIDKNLKINVIDSSTSTIDLGKNTLINIFTTSKTNSTTNLNLYSPIIRIQYKNTSFIFTGDAEIPNEISALASSFPLNSDVLKVGHHGSSTSTSMDFYNAVSPSVVVISVGKDNSYNHPSQKTLLLLKKNPTKLYRTDNDGTIVLVSDGQQLSSIFPDK